MPELPEVEATRRHLASTLLGETISRIDVRDARLRWPVPERSLENLHGRRVDAIERRAKYLLLRTRAGNVIVHLGMSGSLRVVSDQQPPHKHDHLDVVFRNGQCLRLRDARRFGAVLWASGNPLLHPLLANLGPEPLDEVFDGRCLYRMSRKRRVAVKSFIMNSRTVAGVGNIYASEALFLARIHPARPAGRIALRRYDDLASAIKRVLQEAITQGGTTLRDFVNSDGRPGYFGQQLRVYGRLGSACENCGRALKKRIIDQRSSFFCGHCQH